MFLCGRDWSPVVSRPAHPACSSDRDNMSSGSIALRRSCSSYVIISRPETGHRDQHRTAAVGNGAIVSGVIRHTVVLDRKRQTLLAEASTPTTRQNTVLSRFASTAPRLRAVEVNAPCLACATSSSTVRIPAIPLPTTTNRGRCKRLMLMLTRAICQGPSTCACSTTS